MDYLKDLPSKGHISQSDYSNNLFAESSFFENDTVKSNITESGFSKNDIPTALNSPQDSPSGSDDDSDEVESPKLTPTEAHLIEEAEIPGEEKLGRKSKAEGGIQLGNNELVMTRDELMNQILNLKGKNKALKEENKALKGENKALRRRHKSKERAFLSLLRRDGDVGEDD